MTANRTLPDPAVEPTIKAERVAAILGVSVRGAYAAIERGEIPAIRVGRSVRIPTARFLAAFGLETTPTNSEAGVATPAIARIPKDATCDHRSSTTAA